MTRIRAAAVALIGLGAATARADDAGRLADAAATSCEAQVAAYRKWIAKAPRMVFPATSPYVRLAEGSGRGPEWLAESQTTEVRPNGVFYQGMKFGVAEWQERLQEDLKRMPRPPDQPLALEIDRDAKWSLVSDAVNAAGAAGIQSIVFLVVRRSDVRAPGGSPPPQPRVPPADGDRRWELSLSISARIQALGRALRPCRPAAEALPQLGGIESKPEG